MHSQIRTFTVMIAVPCLLLLAACGGGGSGGGPKKTMMDQPTKPTDTGMETPAAIVVSGDQQLVGDIIDPSRYSVVDGSLVRRPIPSGVTWEPKTDYPVFDHLPSRYPNDDNLHARYYYGQWSDSSRLFFGGHRFDPGSGKLISTFGVALEDDDLEPYTRAVEPPTDFADSPLFGELEGVASYNGTLVGLTTGAKQPMGAGVDIELQLGDLTGHIDYINIMTIDRDGTLGDYLADIRHDIAVRGNTVVKTGGGPGNTTAVFAGEHHRAITGVVEHSQFSGGFSAEYGQTTSAMPTRPVIPNYTGDWWLPDNTQAIVQGQSPTVTIAQIPQELVDTGDIAGALSPLISHGYGRQYDGAYVAVQKPLEYPTGTWANRAVAAINGVSFAERARSSGTSLLGVHEKRIVGFLDYASFGMWLNEAPGGDQLGQSCCEWAVYNDASVTDRGSKDFLQGTYVWNGAMVGAEKRDATRTILGDARIELQVNAVAKSDPSNTLDVSFTNVKKVNDGSAVSDMSWQLNRIGRHGARGFWVDKVGTGIYDGNLVSGSGNIAMTWSGPNHANVVGVYENTTYVGSFGGTKR